MAKQLVRNAHGRPIPCCWSDCWDRGDNRYRVEVPHDAPKFPGEKLVYIFCRPRHRSYWLHANRPGRYGTLPTGERRSPLGLILPG